jgi:hypothetical protein
MFTSRKSQFSYRFEADAKQLELRLSCDPLPCEILVLVWYERSGAPAANQQQCPGSRHDSEVPEVERHSPIKWHVTLM